MIVRIFLKYIHVTVHSCDNKSQASDVFLKYFGYLKGFLIRKEKMIYFSIHFNTNTFDIHLT